MISLGPQYETIEVDQGGKPVPVQFDPADWYCWWLDFKAPEGAGSDAVILAAIERFHKQTSLTLTHNQALNLIDGLESWGEAQKKRRDGRRGSQSSTA